MTPWRRPRAALAALLLLPTLLLPRTAAATLEPLPCGDASGYVLLQPISTRGEAKAGVTVVDPATGETTGQIDTPAIDAAFPTDVPGRALAIAGSRLFLLDAEALTADPIPLATSAQELSPNPVQFRGTAGERYVLLGSPSFDRVYLIDVETGAAADLTALVGAGSEAPVFVQFAAVTPGDGHVVLWDGQHVYVVEAAAPEGATRVDEGAFAFSPDVSPDGSELVYSESAGPGSGSTLVLAGIDGSSRQELRQSDRAQVTLWVPRSRTILIDERTETGAAEGRVMLYDLDSGEERAVLAYEGSLTTVQLSPDGRRALLGVEASGGGDWYLADLEQGSAERLTSLDPGQAFPGLYADARWALVSPGGTEDRPMFNAGFKGVDLATGDVSRLLDQGDFSYVVQPLQSRDGRFTVIVGENDEGQTAWLLDAKELRSRELASAKQVSVALSPDGCHVAVSRDRNIDGLPSYATEITAATAKSTRDAGNGRVLTWVPGQTNGPGT